MILDLDTIILILSNIFESKDRHIHNITKDTHEQIISKTLINQGQSEVISYLRSIRSGDVDAETIQRVLKGGN